MHVGLHSSAMRHLLTRSVRSELSARMCGRQIRCAADAEVTINFCSMASELSQLIESELRKAEGANKPDEHQRRLASLRVKVCLVICRHVLD